MRSRLLVTATCAALWATPSAAQAPGGPMGAWIAGPIETADALYFAGEPEKAFELLREHLVASPDDYDALWRIIRSTVVLGAEAETLRFQNSWWDTGMEYGERAVSIRPDGVEARYWRGAAMGRRALNAAPEFGAELAQRAYEDAYAILAIDPRHGGAHNILGRIFFEVMSMSRVQRWLGRTFMRTEALKESSWEAAEVHLEAAAADWPDSVLLQFDLAELYRRRGREDEAREVYARVTEMSAVHPSDPAVQLDAQRMLEQLGS